MIANIPLSNYTKFSKHTEMSVTGNNISCCECMDIACKSDDDMCAFQYAFGLLLVDKMSTTDS